MQSDSTVLNTHEKPIPRQRRSKRHGTMFSERKRDAQVKMRRACQVNILKNISIL